MSPKMEIALTFASGQMPLCRAVSVATEFSDDGRPVVSPANIRAWRATNHATLVLRRIFVAEAPRPFDIDDAHSLATPTAEHPGVTCIDSAGRGIEVDLTVGEVRRRWGSIDRRWRHLVERRLRRRLRVGSLNGLVLPQLFRNRAELLLGCLHAIIDRQIRCRRTVPQAWQPQ